MISTSGFLQILDGISSNDRTVRNHAETQYYQFRHLHPAEFLRCLADEITGATARSQLATVLLLNDLKQKYQSAAFRAGANEGVRDIMIRLLQIAGMDNNTMLINVVSSYARLVIGAGGAFPEIFHFITQCLEQGSEQCLIMALRAMNQLLELKQQQLQLDVFSILRQALFTSSQQAICLAVRGLRNVISFDECIAGRNTLSPEAKKQIVGWIIESIRNQVQHSMLDTRLLQQQLQDFNDLVSMDVEYSKEEITVLFGLCRELLQNGELAEQVRVQAVLLFQEVCSDIEIRKLVKEEIQLFLTDNIIGYLAYTHEQLSRVLDEGDEWQGYEDTDLRGSSETCVGAVAEVQGHQVIMPIVRSILRARPTDFSTLQSHILFLKASVPRVGGRAVAGEAEQILAYLVAAYQESPLAGAEAALAQKLCLAAVGVLSQPLSPAIQSHHRDIVAFLLACLPRHQTQALRALGGAAAALERGQLYLHQGALCRAAAGAWAGQLGLAEKRRLLEVYAGALEFQPEVDPRVLAGAAADASAILRAGGQYTAEQAGFLAAAARCARFAARRQVTAELATLLLALLESAVEHEEATLFGLAAQCLLPVAAARAPLLAALLRALGREAVRTDMWPACEGEVHVNPARSALQGQALLLLADALQQEGGPALAYGQLAALFAAVQDFDALGDAQEAAKSDAIASLLGSGGGQQLPAEEARRLYEAVHGHVRAWALAGDGPDQLACPSIDAVGDRVVTTLLFTKLVLRSGNATYCAMFDANECVQAAAVWQRAAFGLLDESLRRIHEDDALDVDEKASEAYDVEQAFGLCIDGISDLYAELLRARRLVCSQVDINEVVSGYISTLADSERIYGIDSPGALEQCAATAIGTCSDVFQDASARDPQEAPHVAHCYGMFQRLAAPFLDMAAQGQIQYQTVQVSFYAARVFLTACPQDDAFIQSLGQLGIMLLEKGLTGPDAGALHDNICSFLLEAGIVRNRDTVYFSSLLPYLHCMQYDAEEVEFCLRRLLAHASTLFPNQEECRKVVQWLFFGPLFRHMHTIDDIADIIRERYASCSDGSQIAINAQYFIETSTFQ